MEEIKNCSNCKNNVEFPPPHTCDICTSLDEEEYCMWESDKNEEDLKNRKSNMTKEKGHLVEYNRIFEGYVIPCNGLPKKKIKGYRVFNDDMKFQGLLDTEKLALWYVEETTLVELN